MSRLGSASDLANTPTIRAASAASGCVSAKIPRRPSVARTDRTSSRSSSTPWAIWRPPSQYGLLPSRTISLRSRPGLAEQEATPEYSDQSRQMASSLRPSRGTSPSASATPSAEAARECAMSDRSGRPAAAAASCSAHETAGIAPLSWTRWTSLGASSRRRSASSPTTRAVSSTCAMRPISCAASSRVRPVATASRLTSRRSCAASPATARTTRCGLITPSHPPDSDSTTRSATADRSTRIRAASSSSRARCASSRVKSLRPPLPSVLPMMQTTSAGSSSPASISRSSPEVSDGPAVGTRHARVLTAARRRRRSQLNDDAPPDSGLDVDLVHVAVGHLGRFGHARQGLHDLRGVHRQDGHRLRDAQREIVPGADAEHDPVPGREHEAAQVLEPGQVLAQLVAGLSHDHRERLVAEPDEKLRHVQVALEPGHLTAALVDPRRAHDGLPIAHEGDVVSLFDGAVVEGHRESRVRHVGTDEQAVLRHVVAGGRQDGDLHDGDLGQSGHDANPLPVVGPLRASNGYSSPGAGSVAIALARLLPVTLPPAARRRDRAPPTRRAAARRPRPGAPR